MNKVMFTISAAVVSSLFAVGNATAGFTGLQYEDVENNMAGYTTWRIYAGTDGEVDAVYGDGASTLTVNSDTGFFNGIGTGATATNNNDAFWASFPSNEFDSMVSIGMTHTNSGGSMSVIGIDFTDFDAGGDIESNNGSWYSTPDQPNVLAGAEGRVLLGQFTMYGLDSSVSGVLNLQGKEGDFETFVAEDVFFYYPIPAPGALALLGLAGLAARRRRK